VVVTFVLHDSSVSWVEIFWPPLSENYQQEEVEKEKRVQQRNQKRKLERKKNVDMMARYHETRFFLADATIPAGKFQLWICASDVIYVHLTYRIYHSHNHNQCKVKWNRRTAASAVVMDSLSNNQKEKYCRFSCYAAGVIYYLQVTSWSIDKK